MGLFGNLFDKKICDICGDEIGLLGNRKLEDGNCCKNCAKKLSPWFNERRESTVEEIKAQLAYREANQADVANFNTSRVFGDDVKLMLDEGAGVFMVTGARDWREANPDVIKFSQVTGCELDIQERRDEVKRTVRDSEGNSRQESYSPPRYKYKYRFNYLIRVNHPYFDEIRFDLNSSSVEVKADSMSRMRSSFRIGAGEPEGSPNPPSMADRRETPDYRRYEEMGREIREILMSARQQPEAQPVQAQPAAAPVPEAPAQKVICPWCGASTGTATGECECCGGTLNG